jgi:hypothetical protein
MSFEFTRRYSIFAPDFTYAVRVDGSWIGEVARMKGERRWWASNKTWTGGHDFDAQFPTRRDAANALWEEENKC